MGEKRDPGGWLLRVAFGDRTGAYVFVAALVFFGVYWSITFFSTDTLTIANTLVAVSEGHLHIDKIVYGPSSLAQPGTNIVDGKLYGRNYGQVAIALPILLAVRGFSTVADVSVLLVGTWCLGVLALTIRVGAYFGRREQATVLGSGAVLLLFVVNAALATRIPPRMYPLLALQIGSMIAAALIAVVLYRWLSEVYDRRVGLFAGIGTAVATPVGFWASIPKRHSLTALLVVLVLFSFYRSRATETHRGFLQFRVLSYVWVALTAWVHGGEAFVLLVALVTIDLPTARDNSIRTLSLVGVTFALALVPFFATNLVVTGNPVEPPRLAPGFNSGDLPPGVDPSPGVDDPVPGEEQTPTPEGTPTPEPRETTTADPGGQPGATATPAGGTPPSSDSTPGGGSGGGIDPLAVFTGVVGGLVSLLVGGVDAFRTLVSLSVSGVEVLGSVVDRFWRLVNRSLRIFTDADRLVDVFLRSGYIEGLRQPWNIPVNMTMLESMPLFGAFAATPVLGIRAVRSRIGDRNWPLTPARQTDLLGISVLLLFVLVYSQRLPLHHMYTVRYLHPFYPVGVYFLARVPAVRAAMTTNPRTLVGSYGVTVLAGVPLYLFVVQSLGLVRSEAVQLYALCALAVAALLAVWTVLATALESRDLTQSGGAVLGLAAGAMTVYLLVGGIELFSRGTEAVLPVVRLIGESIRAVTG